MSQRAETKKKKLSLKEKRFSDDYIKTGNGTQSALKVYDTEDPNTAANIASTNLTKPKIINYIASRLPDELLTEKHQALLNKEEVIVRNNMTSGEIEVIPTGQIDVQAVKAGLDMAYKIKGSYAPEKRITTRIELNEETKAKVRTAIQELLNNGDNQ